MDLEHEFTTLVAMGRGRPRDDYIAQSRISSGPWWQNRSKVVDGFLSLIAEELEQRLTGSHKSRFPVPRDMSDAIHQEVMTEWRRSGSSSESLAVLETLFPDAELRRGAARDYRKVATMTLHYEAVPFIVKIVSAEYVSLGLEESQGHWIRPGGR